MVASYTTNLRLTKQGDNDNPNTWGQIVNSQVVELLEDAISGVATIDLTGSSNINISTSTVNGGYDVARNAVLLLTGTLGANIDLIVPSVDKVYLVKTTHSGAFTVRIIPSGGSTGITMSSGETKVLAVNGTTIHEFAESLDGSVFLEKSQNLNDLPNKATARTNLGVPTLEQVYPVGSIYMNATNPANPNSIFGFGTWTAFAQGRVLIGVGTGTDVNGTNRTFANGDTGGEYTHTQTINEMPPHDHDQRMNSGSGPTSFQPGTGSSTTVQPPKTGMTGGGQAMEWMQPYLTVFMWLRTA